MKCSSGWLMALDLTPADFFILRAPHLSVDELRRWADDAVSPSSSSEAENPDAKIALDRARLREGLRALVARPAVREAVTIASASLSRRLAKWEANPDSKDGAKVEQAIVRYLGRMASRSTPFGLFAGVAVGRLGHQTSLTVAPEIQRRVRLDMGCVVAISEKLERDPVIRAHVRYRANPSMYESGGRLHVPALTAGEEGRSYALSAVEVDDALRQAIARAGTGASRAEIASALIGDGVTEPEALEYVDSLVDAGVLESSLSPAITGDDPLVGLERALGACLGERSSQLETLTTLRRSLRELETLPLGVGVERYEEIGDLVGALASADASRAVQVDMMRPTTATLGPSSIASIARAVRAAWITNVRPPNPELERFVEAFTERYGQREVSLAEVLDDETGIGFRDPASGRGEDDKEPAVPAAQRALDAMLLEKLERAWSKSDPAITLSEEDLAKLEEFHRSPLPASVAAFVTLLSDDRVQLHGVVGASAARLLGRFCPWSDEMTDALKAHLREEESSAPDAVFAEIVHLPIASRTANVLLRPVLRDHEIAFCGRSGAPDDRTIGIADLFVSASGSRIVLRSRRLGREVIPRLSSAHNSETRQLAIYRFLSALQGQGVASNAAFSWGSFASARTLPRVVSGSCILSPQTWNVDKDELRGFGDKTPQGRFRAAAKLRETRGIPRWVGLQDGDNILPVDFDNSLSIDAFAAITKTRESARLVELFVESDDLVARGEGGRFAHEIVVPFIFRPTTTSTSSGPEPAATKGGHKATAAPLRVATRPRPAPAVPTARRVFAPGSEWLYAKIYAARSSIDHVLRTCRPMIDAAKSSGAIDRWFFIRYDDPDAHLRLRLHGDASRLLQNVIPDLHRALEPLLDAGRVQRIELATYERELERYGGDHGIDHVERIFWADSEACLRITDLDLGPDSASVRRAVVLLGMHRLLDDFALDIPTRVKITNVIRDGFALEQRITPERERNIADFARKERRYVDAWLASEPDEPTAGLDRAVKAKVEAIFAERSKVAREHALALRATRRAGKLGVSTEEMVESLLHMWNNRMLRANARGQELVLHTLLARHYESLEARARRAPKASDVHAVVTRPARLARQAV
jgi:lantibiotic biosynthesis protein